MAELVFLPSSHRAWTKLCDSPRTVYVTGWAAVGDAILSEKALAQHVLNGASSSRAFSDVIGMLNGNFSVVFDNGEAIYLGVDAVRSIPLFYREEGTVLKVSDDIRPLCQNGDKIDPDSLIEFATAGYVTGAHTLFSEIKAVQSGEYVSWNVPKDSPSAQRYYRYCCSYDAEDSVEELCNEFDGVLLSTFRRIIESLDGRQVVVPLSAGLDSRLVASMLKRCGYERVLCFYYGVPGSKQEVCSRETAKTLGYEWVYVPYSGSLWREALASEEMKCYWSFSWNGVSLPHCDDWLAVRALRELPQVSKDAVFVPGHTGDFICGSHLKYVFDPRWHEEPHAFNEAMIKKHYSLWDNLVTGDRIRGAIIRRLHEVLEAFPDDTDEDLARMYEYWEWQERQAKYIINSVRVYEFFGFDWRIPLWDCSIMNFWARIPIALKMAKFFYRSYLASYNLLGVFQDVGPTSPWSRELILKQRKRSLRVGMQARLQSVKPVALSLRRCQKFLRHLREYRYHPVGLCRAYGIFRYLFSEPSKRHAQALLLSEFLRHECAVEIAKLLSRTGLLNYLGETTD